MKHLHLSGGTAARRIQIRRGGNDMDTEGREDRIIYIENQKVVYPIRSSQISHIQAGNRSLKITLIDGRVQHLRYMTLQRFMDEVDRKYFVQCSRSGIVNMDYVDNIDYGNRMITMKNQEQMAIGTTYVKFLREQLRNVHDMWQRKRLLQDTGDVLG